MNQGWVCYPRKVQDSFLYPRRRAFTSFEAYTDLWLSATHRPYSAALKASLRTIRRGELMTSQVQLAKRWSWGRNRVARFLRLCHEERLLDFETSPDVQASYTLITLPDYDPGRSTGSSSQEVHKRSTAVSETFQKRSTGSSSGAPQKRSAPRSAGEALNKEGKQGNEEHTERRAISLGVGKKEGEDKIQLPEPFFQRPDAPEVKRLFREVPEKERDEILDSIGPRLPGIVNLPAYLRSVIKRRNGTQRSVEEDIGLPENESPLPKSSCCGQFIVFDVASGGNICGTCRKEAEGFPVLVEEAN